MGVVGERTVCTRQAVTDYSLLCVITGIKFMIAGIGAGFVLLCK